MKYDFDWGILWQEPFGQWILDALWTTAHLALLSWAIALVVGIPIGAIRVAKRPALRALGTCYVEVFRNIPLLVQLFMWFYVFPLLLPDDWRLWWNRLPHVAYWTGVLGLSLFTAARVAEQVRSGMLAIPPGQYQAAMSTGLTPVQGLRHVILPHATRLVIPGLSSEFLTIFKNTALAMTIGVAEITYTARGIETWSFHGIEAYTFASLTYLATTLAVVLFMGRLERRLAIPGQLARAAG